MPKSMPIEIIEKLITDSMNLAWKIITHPDVVMEDISHIDEQDRINIANEMLDKAALVAAALYDVPENKIRR